MADAVAFSEFILKEEDALCWEQGALSRALLNSSLVCGWEFPFLRYILEDGARGASVRAV